MAIDFLFKIGNTDVTGNIVQNTYAVAKLPVYKTYEDANGASHRRFIRNKVQGSFQMAFPDLTAYSTFRSLIETNMSQTNYSVAVTLYDNLTGSTISTNVFIDYKPTVMQSTSLKEFMKPIDVTIEER